MSNPFASSPSAPGRGTIHLARLPPNTPRLRTVHYQYPLKLVSPAPLRTEADPGHVVHTVYLLTYGGGLVAGDGIDLDVTLEDQTRLVLLTQGSTKLFKSPSRDVRSKQCMTVTLHPGSSLCYLPDPVQPFRDSSFEQHQIYNIHASTPSGAENASLCVLDWVSNGRPANGENWSFFHYASKTEVYLQNPEDARKLLLRDSLMLDELLVEKSLTQLMIGFAVYGTLIVHGPMLHSLGHFFMTEFNSLPRIGGRKWDSGSDSGGDNSMDPVSIRRAERHRMEAATKVIWSAASVRGCVVVKFGAPELEAGRQWLWTMLTEEGSVVAQFGERALLCLR